MRMIRLIGVACALVLLGAACSNDTLSTGPTPQVEKSALIAQGDAICAQLDTDQQQLLDAFKSAHPNPTSADALDFFTNQLLPRYDRAVGDIHRIGEPTKDRADYDAAVKALDEGLTKFKEEISQDPVKVLASGTTAFDHANKLFTDYGFTKCGASSSTSSSSPSASTHVTSSASSSSSSAN